MRTLIADTSCLRLLSQIQQLDLLPALFTEVNVTPVVQAEFGAPLPAWVRVRASAHGHIAPYIEMEMGRDADEASAIALALETPGCELLIDDSQSRKIARRLHLAVVGTVGVGIRAKRNGVLPELLPYLNALLAAGLQLDPDIVAAALDEVGESVPG